MLSRRHLRIRVLQGLYSYYQSGNNNPLKAEQEIFKGIENTYDLFLFLLLIFPEIADEERIYRTDLQPKHIISKAEKEVVHSLAHNLVVKVLSDDESLRNTVQKHHISWQADHELVKKIFHQLRNTDEYKQYVTSVVHSEERDVEFATWLFKKFVIESDLFKNTVEEKNIFWADGFDFAAAMAIRTIKMMKPGKSEKFELAYIYKDEADDKEFVKMLLHNTIKNDAYFTEIIDAKTKNWDVERIALVDVILLKMTLCEVLYLPTVPVKVSINEYLDIAKDFSTPKSNHFINGIVDKLVIDLRNENKIVKTGRGLME